MKYFLTNSIAIAIALLFTTHVDIASAGIRCNLALRACTKAVSHCKAAKDRSKSVLVASCGKCDRLCMTAEEKCTTKSELERVMQSGAEICRAHMKEALSKCEEGATECSSAWRACFGVGSSPGPDTCKNCVTVCKVAQQNCPSGLHIDPIRKINLALGPCESRAKPTPKYNP